MIASLEAGDLKGKRIGTQWRITRAQLAAVPAVSAVADAPASRADDADDRRDRAREVSLPRLRRRSALEPGEAGARLPVLRHRVAGDAARRAAPTPSSSSTISRRRSRRIPDDARGWQAEKTSVRCQSCQAISVFDPDEGRPALRLLRIGAARAVRAGQGRVPARVAAAAQDLRVAGARSDSRAGTDASGWRRTRSSRRRSPTRSRASTCRTGPSTRTRTPRGPPRRASTTTRVEGGKQVRHVRWTPASGELSHVFDDELVPASVGVRCRPAARRSSRFRPATLDPVRPRLSRRLDGRALSDRPRRRRRRARAQQMEAALERLCAAQVPGDTHRNLSVHATFADQRSSTSSCRSGC